ncbi:MAG: NUDIX hydrolase [Anaerolineae bacterium]|jgi:8-oxo-dGTP pyrophosphatase MutT (NUDIX family)
MEEWQTLARRTLLEHSEYLTVEEHTVALPDGRVIPNWPWLITPDFAIVLAVTRPGAFLCLRQTKYGVGQTLAPVGGYIEPGEDPLETAQRELLEETGHTAEDWTELGEYQVDGNRGAGRAYLYLAQGARWVVEPDADDLEEQRLVYLDRAELEAALDAGEFKVLAWATAVALALRHLEA